MNALEWIAEQKIRSAIESGQWDNLRGKGKPLQWDENPFEPPEWRMAFSLLRQNGFSLPWLEERKDIEAEIQHFSFPIHPPNPVGQSAGRNGWDKKTN